MKDKIFAIELAFENAPHGICQCASERTQDKQQLHRMLHNLNAAYFVLRTCRRIAVFSTSACPGKMIHFFESLGIEKKYVQTYKNEEAVKHLLEIAGGLHSPNVGEHEILFQLKSVLKEASFLKSLDVILRKLLQKSIETGRRIRSETTILKDNLSYPAVVHKILREKDINIEGEKILITGNGKLGNSLVKYFRNRQARITLATRNPEKAETWGNSVQIIARDEIAAVLADYKVVIGAASAKKILVSKESIAALKQVPLFFDLAMPANFDPALGKILPDFFFNLDRIFSKTRELKHRKKIALQETSRIVEEETTAFIHWLKGRKAVKIINTLKEELEQIKSEEHSRLLNDFGKMDIHQQKAISKLVNRLTSRIAHTHYSHIKEFVVHEQS